MNSIGGWIIGIVIFLGIFYWVDAAYKYEGEDAEYWYNQYEEAQYEAERYQEALDQANSNIEDAKYSAWSSYEEMGDALDYLESVTP